MLWFKKKPICTSCNKRKTNGTFEGAIICAVCELKILAERETVRMCPIDDIKMEKEMLSDVVIDRCPACGGVWLDKGELQLIKQHMGAKGEEEGWSNGFVLGLIIG